MQQYPHYGYIKYVLNDKSPPLLTSAVLAVFPPEAPLLPLLLTLLQAHPRVEDELRSLVDIERELVHVPQGARQAVYRPQAHRRDAVRAVAAQHSSMAAQRGSIRLHPVGPGRSERKRQRKRHAPVR